MSLAHGPNCILLFDCKFMT